MDELIRMQSLVCIVCGLLIAVFVFLFLKKYREGAYYQITHLPYLSVRADLGRYGEYLTYQNLKGLEKEGARFLFNVYLPKENGETTEIDVLMLTEWGLISYESKNYSGWIFGSEDQKNWYQTLPQGKGKSNKESFYNPVMQNRSHIKHLKELIGDDVPIHSVIVFSDRCTLKNITMKSFEIPVVNRSGVYNATLWLKSSFTGFTLTTEKKDKLYEILYPLTQADEATKAQHVAAIREKFGNENVVPRAAAKPTDSPAADTASPVGNPAEIKRVSAETVCPKCGGKPVLRTATRGANAGKHFYGCSNYPNCRFIFPQKNNTENERK